MARRPRRLHPGLARGARLAARGAGSLGLLTALLGLASGAYGQTCRRVDFTGEIVHGQRFERPIVDGLIFRLDPEPGAAGTGWMVRVIRLPEEDEDYAGVMTPPYRGVNHRFIEGWHFRNRENTGVNQSDVNAPQYDREFGFVLTRDD